MMSLFSIFPQCFSFSLLLLFSPFPSPFLLLLFPFFLLLLFLFLFLFSFFLEGWVCIVQELCSCSNKALRGQSDGLCASIWKYMLFLLGGEICEKRGQELRRVVASMSMASARTEMGLRTGTWADISICHLHVSQSQATKSHPDS